MTRISFGNPVAGPIRPPGSPPIKGSFRVTATFGQTDADHPTPHIGVDIGDLLCGEPVLAMASGKVTMAELLGQANVVRIRHKQFGDVESGYAHLASIGVGHDQDVARGQVIGTLGKTGANACHLHVGVKIDGTEVNGWPLLDQNQETDMLKGTHPVRLFNRKSLVLGDNTRFRAGPSTDEPVLATYAKGAEIAPDFIVDGGLVKGSPQWYGTWGNTDNGKEFGYLHISTVSPLEPME